MGNLLEKITLYDILGYMFPGCVLLLFLFLGACSEDFFAFLNRWKENMGILSFLFILASYLCGIILSELTELAVWIKKKIRAGKPVEWEKDASLREQVAAALIKSGYHETKEDIKTEIENKGLTRTRYMGYMYGAVQGSAEYKRIHDYASAFVLYKNLAAAFAIGTAALALSGKWDFGALAAGGVCCLLMINRSIRFYHKKNLYAVVWFLDKYLKME